MSLIEYVEHIFKTEKFKGLCIQKAKHKYLADDLHSEFIEALLNSEEAFNKAYKEGYIDVYCVGIIHNIWGKKDRVKIHYDGKTSPLFNYSSTLEIPESEDNEVYLEYFKEPTQEPCISYDYKYIEKTATNILEREVNHPNNDRMYKARVFYYSTYVYKSPSEFSKRSGIPYMNVYMTWKRFKEQFKKVLND